MGTEFDAETWRACASQATAALEKAEATIERWRPVIEAAKALKIAQLDNAAGWTALEQRFVEAIEALEEQEGQ